MLLSERQIRALIADLILEGFKDDQRYLQEKYPQSADKIGDLSPKHISWLIARFGDSPSKDETHPFEDVIVTLSKFAKKDSGIGEKYKTNEQFRNAIDAAFPPESRGWQTPNDITTMSIDDMDLILGLSERKKQRIEVKKVDIEQDRVGKFGLWNVWMPTTRDSSVEIAQYDPVTLEPKTTWCTARTAGSNLFYNYAGRGIILFYLIKDKPSGDNDWLSIGYVGGKMVFNGDGTESVNRANKGLTIKSLQNHLGKYYKEIVDVMDQKVAALGGTHPAQQKFKESAQNVDAYNDLVRGLSQEETADLKKMLMSTQREIIPDVIRLLASDKSKDVVEHFVDSGHPLPDDMTDEYIDSGNVRKRYKAAHQKNLSSEQIEKLSDDSAVWTRNLIASRKDLTPEMQLKFASDESLSVKHALIIAYLDSETKSLNLPENVVELLLNDPDPEVQIYLARYGVIPPDRLNSLLDVASDQIRLSIAQITTDPAAINRLAADPSNSVRRAVAYKRDLTPEAARILLKGAKSDILYPLASNAKVPADVLRTIAAKTKDPTLMMGLASNVALPIDLLKALVTYAGRKKDDVASSVFQYQPIEKLEQLAADPEIDEMIRAKIATAIADRPNQPQVFGLNEVFERVIRRLLR